MQSDVSREAVALAGLDVSRETLDRLECYVALLLRWNQTVNLIGRGDERQVWKRHIADCAQLATLVPPTVESAIDMGSGAGLPGLVLALLTGIQFDLIEADHRKAAFLREAARATGAPVRMHAVRAESAALRPAMLVTARAVASVGKLLGMAAPHLQPGGLCLFPKGATAEIELTEARRQWHMQVKRVPSRTSPGALILLLSEIHPVGAPTRGAG